MPTVGADRQGSGRCADAHGTSSRARARGVRHPGSVMTHGPAEGAVPVVADGQGLNRWIAATLLSGKGQTQWGHAQRGID